MIPFGLGLRNVVALARNARAESSPGGTIAVSGPGADAVAAALNAGGEPGCVIVRSDPAGVAAVVRVLDREPGADDCEVLRAGARAGIPLVALTRGDASAAVPYVLATDVVEWPPDAPLPLGELARVLTRGLQGDAARVAARIPILREHAVRRQTCEAAGSAAALGLLRSRQGPLAPVLTLLQARMLRRVATARGEAAPIDAQRLATVVVGDLAAAIATGLVARTLVRALPFRNRLVDAGVAYGGTAALAALSGRVRGRR